MTTATRPLEPTERVARREWKTSRVLPAPRELVFKAWIVPSLLALWWGPKGFASPVCDLDPRPGGSYRIVMRHPDGVDYPLKGVYLEIVEPERIVMTEDWDEHPPKWHRRLLAALHGDPAGTSEALTTVTFGEHTGLTTITVTTRFESAAVRDAMVAMGMEEGWSQSLDRLAELLARL